jgi:formylglycine-generating enzyme
MRVLASVIAAATAAACAPAPAVQRCAVALEIGARVAVPAGEVDRGVQRFAPEEAAGGEGAVRAFSIDAHEVTNAQYAAFVEATGYVTIAERPGEDGRPLGAAVFDRETGLWRMDAQANWRRPEGARSSVRGRERYPVVAVAYEDAEAYARWAGRRLPSENEWEFAARGAAPARGDIGAEAFDAAGRPIANTWQGLFPLQDTAQDGFAGLAPVGCFPPNALGLHDMIGNVWEWTSDVFEGAPAQDVGRGEGAAPPRVLKGGSNLCARNFCSRFRSGSRQPGDPGLGMSHVGFRTAADAP